MAYYWKETINLNALTSYSDIKLLDAKKRIDAEIKKRKNNKKIREEKEEKN